MRNNFLWGCFIEPQTGDAEWLNTPIDSPEVVEFMVWFAEQSAEVRKALCLAELKRRVDAGEEEDYDGLLSLAVAK